MAVVKKVLKVLGFVIFLMVGYYTLTFKKAALRIDENGLNDGRIMPTKPSYTIHIAVVICGSRLEEGLVMLKSAVIFSHSYLVLHVFTEESLKESIKEEFASWPFIQKNRLKLAIHNIEFPKIPGCTSCTPTEWKQLFRPCATQRLFIPDILIDVDALIYLDSDTIFLTSVESAWKQFTNFGQKHVFGVVSELESWYSEHFLPHCTKTGICGPSC